MKRAVILIMLYAAALYAHDLWICPHEGGVYTLHYGHLGHAHKGKKTLKYKAEFIKEVMGFDKSGNRVNVNYEKEYPLKISKGPAVVFVVFSTGYWTKTVEGEKNLPKDSVDMPIKSWLSYEYVKYMNTWNKSLAKPLTEYLEITPLFDINRVKKGDKVTFLVTFKGKPIRDVVVAYDGKPRGTTDEEGKVNIRIMKKGLQLIQATYKEKGDGKKTDEIIHTTALNWEVK